MATAAPIPASVRGAPLGVPVVPDVRITTRLCRDGGAWSAVDPLRIIPSTVSASVSASVHARTRCSVVAASISAANSSSYTTAPGISRSRTSTSWGPANAVLR